MATPPPKEPGIPGIDEDDPTQVRLRPKMPGGRESDDDRTVVEAEPPPSALVADPEVPETEDHREDTDPNLRIPTLLAADGAAAAETVKDSVTFEASQRATVLAHFDVSESTQAPEKLAPERPVSYLIIDQGTYQDTDSYFALRSELSLLVDARDFQITHDDNGNIVIIALSERGGIQKLLSIAKSISQVRPKGARMAIKSGTVRLHGKNHFSLAGYPDSTPAAAWRTAMDTDDNTTTFIAKDLAAQIQDPGSRVGKIVRLEVEEFVHRQAPDPDFLALKRWTAKTSLESGGPDRIIGYENQLKALGIYAQIAVPEDDEPDETKLVVLEGHAGMGKSRLLGEILASHPAYVLSSIDPADRNVLGSSLVTVANQLITAVQEDEVLGFDQIAPAQVKRTVVEGIFISTDESATAADLSTPITFAEFAGLPHAEQIKYAAKNPKAVADLCYNALQQLTFLSPANTLFVLEDIHHADRVSVPFLTALIQRYLHEMEGRAVLSMRPEEMYKSTAIEDLESQVKGTNREKKDPVKRISVCDGLNFAEDPNLAHDFAYCSLPQDVREGRSLGLWYMELAKIAGRSPWVMKSLMDSVLERDKTTGDFKHLIISDTLIEINRDFLARITTINPTSASDIATYFHERIANLDEKTRKVLQGVTLMGGKVNSHQISELSRMFGQSIEGLLEIMRELTSGGYAQKTADGSYTLQHESTRDIVLGSLKVEEEKIKLARDLYDKFRTDQHISPNARHELLATIANSKTYAPKLDEDFWEDYLLATDLSFTDAKKHNDTESAHHIAAAVLNSPALQEEIDALKSGEESSDTTTKLIIEALFARAENGRFLGKFKETHEAVTTLIAIHQHFPQKIDIVRAHKVRFNVAHMNNEAGSMEKIFNQDLRNGEALDLPTRLMFQIKMAYRKKDNEGAIRLFERSKTTLAKNNEEHQRRYGMPLPEFIEICRIVYCNCVLERARQAMINRPDGLTFDQDMLMQPGALNNPDQQTELKEAKAALDQIQDLTKSYPLILDHYSEINILDQLGQIAAFQGDPSRAIALFHETWRIAMQMGVYPSAARAAKLKGDVIMLDALRGGIIDQIKVQQAISTYSENGINLALSQMNPESKSPYQRLLRIQRIRAVGILIRSFKLGFTTGENSDLVLVKTKELLKPHIETALQDFKYLNDTWPETAQDPEMCYDIMGYMNYILYAAQALPHFNRQDLDIAIDSELLNSTQYPLMNLSAIAAARTFGDTKVTDGGFGEVSRKRRGLSNLVEALVQSRDTRESTFFHA